MTPKSRGVSNGYRSGLEEKIVSELEARGIEAAFESLKIPFRQPAKDRTYTPDFPLPNGIVIESKGRFMTDDRQKHKWLKEQHPELDIRFVFSNSKNKLSKGSPTSYAMWCEQWGFLYADKSIPDEWLNEPPCQKRIAALQRVAIPKKKKSPTT
ncbi:hypothetical protein [Parasphingorhabdus sp.]|uniref:hypothetical protein n=1 Tax=Parasphingorhabdus sp. TaxID=2709688 RepID=UPI003A92B2CE